LRAALVLVRPVAFDLGPVRLLVIWLPGSIVDRPGAKWPEWPGRLIEWL
jgi:hypothetical protein